jgi:hypothetical protein
VILDIIFFFFLQLTPNIPTLKSLKTIYFSLHSRKSYIVGSDYGSVGFKRMYTVLIVYVPFVQLPYK